MSRAANLVERRSQHRHAGVEGRQAVQNSSGGLRLTGDVMRQEHRPAEKRGDVGAGAGSCRAARRAVEQTHGALGDDDVGVRRRLCREFDDQISAHRPGVEVEGRSARRGGVKRRIDVVRSAFDRCNPQAAPSQGAHQSQRQRCFSRAGARRADQYRGRRHPRPRGLNRRS